MKTTKNLKTIITCILVSCIMLTGIGLDNTVTVNAATNTGIENLMDLAGSTITMKIGDSKTLNLIEDYDGDQFDKTDCFEWTSSDESIVSLHKGFTKSVAGLDKLACVMITAEKEGTATITATAHVTGETISCTVKVEKKKMTAKQKKCKHSWKTTKKATCMRSGMKTCQKCKLQKVILQKKHNFVTLPEAVKTYPEYIIYQCNGCDHPEHQKSGFQCKDNCCMEFRQTEYGSAEAAYEAYINHQTETGHCGSLSMTFEYGKPEITYEPVTRCTMCEMTKEELEKFN